MTSKYIVNKKTNEKYSIDGYVPLDQDQHSYICPKESLPDKIDLRITTTTKRGVVNSLPDAYEYLLKEKNQGNIDINRFFTYYNTHVKGSESSNESDALKYLCTLLPKTASTTQDSEGSEKAKEEQLVWRPILLKIDLNDMKSCLAKGYPFVCAVNLFKSFTTAKNGYIPLPQQDEVKKPTETRHAMIVVGYRDDEQIFIVQNSWGKNWGRNGYCFIPYAYLTDPNLVFDAWAICTVKFNETDKTKEPSLRGTGPVDDGEWIEDDLYDADIEQEYVDDYDEKKTKNNDEWEFVEE